MIEYTKEIKAKNGVDWQDATIETDDGTLLNTKVLKVDGVIILQAVTSHPLIDAVSPQARYQIAHAFL